MFGQGAQASSTKVQRFVQSAFFMAKFFFRKCLLHRPGFGHQIAGAPDCVFCIDSI